MAFSALSFLAGIGVAYLLPVVSRSFRPFAVEAAAMGLGVADDLRRIVAEQMENLEDIAAEARSRREQLIAGPEPEDGEDLAAAGADEPEAPQEAEPPANGNRPRRRAAGRHRTGAA